uniref:Dymeclin n=1 Tax=Macrostomum lignano TaxID=282301 RepID=A0A1I8FRI8_9PLAT
GAADADSEGSGSGSGGISDPIVSAFDIVATRAARQWDNIVPGLRWQQQQQQQGNSKANQTSAGIAAARAFGCIDGPKLPGDYPERGGCTVAPTGGSRPLANLLRTLIASTRCWRANLDSLLATLPESVAVATVASLAPLLRLVQPSKRLADQVCLRKTDALRLLLLLLKHFKLNGCDARMLSLRRPRAGGQAQSCVRVAASFASQQSSSQSISQSSSQVQQQQRE